MLQDRRRLVHRVSIVLLWRHVAGQPTFYVAVNLTCMWACALGAHKNALLSRSTDQKSRLPLSRYAPVTLSHVPSTSSKVVWTPQEPVHRCRNAVQTDKV